MTHAACFAFASVLWAAGFGLAHGEETAPQDLLAFSNGALVENSSPSFGSGWEPLWLIDEEASTGWANQDGSKPPFEIVISLPERSRLQKFGFVTAAAETPEGSAKDVDILISDVSATRYRIPVGTLRDWEQGRFEPDATARAYLTVIALEPELIRNLLATRSGAGDPASEKTTDTAR